MLFRSPVTDLFVRAVARPMGESLGQPLIVDNRGGASGMIGAEYVAKAAPDGYNLLFCTNSQMVGVMYLNKNVPYDPLKDFTPIATTIMPVEVLVVKTSLPFKTVRDLVDFAKQNPGKLSYGSAGVGSVFHLNGEQLNMIAGIQTLHVPYKSPILAAQDVVAGQVDMAFTSYGGIQGLAAGGKLRILGNMEKERYKRLPDVPTIAESIPGYEKVDSWFVMMGPPKLPQAIVTRLNSELVKALKTPEMQKWMDENGAVPLGGSPAQVVELIKSGSTKFKKLVDTIGLKPE